MKKFWKELNISFQKNMVSTINILKIIEIQYKKNVTVLNY